MPAARIKPYRVSELSEEWNVSTDTIYRVFRNEPGVLRIGTKPRKLWLIPVEVVERVARRSKIS